jgi:nicotinate-nucleotide--dimethylbenzimidazole phosphoribosyltransferase
MTSTDTQDWRSKAQAKLDQKTKPLGSLGSIEQLAVTLCGIQQTLTPQVDPARVIIFAADHGVADDGVSLYPKAVTAQMMQNFASGGAAATVLAKQLGLAIEVIDVGVDADLSMIDGIVHSKIQNGSGNIRVQAAMTASALVQAMAVGATAVVRAQQAGCKAVLLGEMGIGNTTSAAALISVLTNHPPSAVVGAGTGVGHDQLQRKIEIVELAIQRYRQRKIAANTPLDLLEQLGGLEIAALVGAIIEAGNLKIAVLIDGFIVSAAALVAQSLQPSCRAVMIFAHRGAERGHGYALEALSASPLLSLDLRLGEASGALLAFGLLRAACTITNDMASFASAGVSTSIV